MPFLSFWELIGMSSLNIEHMFFRASISLTETMSCSKDCWMIVAWFRVNYNELATTSLAGQAQYMMVNMITLANGSNLDSDG